MMHLGIPGLVKLIYFFIMLQKLKHKCIALHNLTWLFQYMYKICIQPEQQIRQSTTVDYSLHKNCTKTDVNISDTIFAQLSSHAVKESYFLWIQYTYCAGQSDVECSGVYFSHTGFGTGMLPLVDPKQHAGLQLRQEGAGCPFVPPDHQLRKAEIWVVDLRRQENSSKSSEKYNFIFVELPQQVHAG
jgi:hypothetical protein